MSSRAIIARNAGITDFEATSQGMINKRPTKIAAGIYLNMTYVIISTLEAYGVEEAYTSIFLGQTSVLSSRVEPPIAFAISVREPIKQEREQH
jgi:hypothetical protein